MRLFNCHYEGLSPYLYFWARIDSLESSDNITIKVSTNGVNWDVLEVFDDNDDDNIYHQHQYDLQATTLNSILRGRRHAPE